MSIRQCMNNLIILQSVYLLEEDGKLERGFLYLGRSWGIFIEFC